MITALSELPRRQREVLAGIVAGKSRKQMARELGIQPKTVSTHVDHLYKRLDVHNRARAAVVGHCLLEAGRADEALATTGSFVWRQGAWT